VKVRRFDRTGKIEQKKSGSIFNFGTLPQKVTGTHLWIFKNEGQGDLVLYKGASTCSCTIANFKDDQTSLTLKPGEQTEIRLTFETRTNNGAYNKGATIITNDPNYEQFILEVQGEVHPAIVTYPAESVANFSTISNDVPEHPYVIALYSP